MGVMSLIEYRCKWYGETESEAKKNLPEPVLTEEQLNDAARDGKAS